jgi:nuclear transcription factor Y gamma
LQQLQLQQLPHPQIPQPYLNLANFWSQQMQEVDESNIDFKNHSLPLARIKKIMKSDEDVRVSLNIPFIFSIEDYLLNRFSFFFFSFLFFSR